MTTQTSHRSQRQITWMPALVLYAASMGASLPAYALGATGADEADDSYMVVCVIGLLVAILSIIAAARFHLNCWRAVPKAYRVTTPGKAVGFMFIPLFNLYWGFITWPKLVDGLKRGGYALPQNARQQAFILAAVSAGSWATLLLPNGLSSGLIYLAIDIGALIVTIRLYAPIIRAINTPLVRNNNPPTTP